MRRMTLKYAKAGMVVEQPVYDNWGNLLVNQFSELTADTINKITEQGVSEVFVRDWRVTDVLVVPLFSPLNEVTLASTFRQLMLQYRADHDINLDLFRKVKIAIGNMVKDIELNIVGDLNVMCNIAQGEYVYLQPVKTAGLCLAIGRSLGFNSDDLINLGLAAVFKDIGLPPEVMENADFISEGASARLKDHPAVGSRILQQRQLVSDEVTGAIMQHHEYWSGAGYPLGLKGNQISKSARVIAISDAFIDLLAARPGRNKYMPHEAIEYVMAFGGDQFDPDIVELFVRQVPSYPAGLSVQMNTGDTGIVCDAKLGFIARPIVRICYRPVQGLLRRPINVDLSQVAYQRMLVTKVLEYD